MQLKSNSILFHSMLALLLLKIGGCTSEKTQTLSLYYVICEFANNFILNVNECFLIGGSLVLIL